VRDPPVIVTVAVPLIGAVFQSLIPSTFPVREVLVRIMEFAPSITPPQSPAELTVAPVTEIVPVE